MTWQNDLLLILRSRAFFKSVLWGAGIAFILLIIFLFVTSRGEMDYGSWVLVPIFSVTVGGGFGGIFYSIMGLFRNQGGRKKVLANIISILVYAAILYCSLIIALDMTGQWS